jgi:PmbA protein
LDAKEGLSTIDALFERLPAGASADARIEGGRFDTMRFANGWIQQPHLEEITGLSLRIALGRRLGTVTTLDLTPVGMRRAIDAGLGLARSAPEEKLFPGFARGGTSSPATPYSVATARLTPEEEGRWATRLIEGARSVVPEGRVSGVLHVGDTWLAVGNTSGRRCRTRRSIVSARVLVERLALDPAPSGWSEAAHFDHRQLDAAALGREAGERVAKRVPEPVRAGTYRVLLGGSAAAKLFSELGYLGFGSRGVEDGWSCLARRRGHRIGPENLDVYDDARSSDTLPQGIDAEGMTKRRTPLIRGGIARGPVLDLLGAARTGGTPTGHAFPPESPWGEYGAVPQNLLVAPGEARSMEELIRETRRGLLVTRFHYVRTVHPGKAILTGMTRDGTYRIERGEIAGPVRNLRFTESILTALRGAELWGRNRRCYADDDERGATCTTASPLLTRAFRFTSATLF